VPAENKLPGANTFKDAARILVATRLSCALGALGAAAGAFDAALSYAKKREQFGKPLGGFQIVQQLSDLTAMQLYCQQMTRLAEQGQLGDTLAGLGKLHNTTKARAILAEARDLLGGMGSCSTSMSCVTWSTSRRSTPSKARRRSRR
jgi:glutaryl-CoA dehydrogenase